jgi:alcohol dehydrogenase (cytochrome c)
MYLHCKAPRPRRQTGSLHSGLRAFLLAAACALAFGQAPPSDGKAAFIDNCVLCHAGDGKGTNRGPSVLSFIVSNEPDEIAAFVRQGAPDKGMPPFDLPDDQLDRLVEYLETLGADDEPADRERVLRLADGSSIRGEILNESGFDAQVRGPNGRVRLLRREGETYRLAEFEPGVDWTTYHGSHTGNRHSPLDQIRRENVATLAPQWFFPVPGQRMIEGTPIVIDGIMYVTGVNQVFALDAATGREIWEYSRPRTKGLIGDPAIGLNRGVAIRGNLLFTVTDHAHAIALDRWTGKLVWDVEMADYRDHYGAIAAPLVVDDLVFFGISGGDTGLRGFLDAYHAATGERAWRFWTIPAPGEPGSETWGDSEVLEKGCGATWLTGSYDPEFDILYWPTGNPCPDLNGDRRPGDNLYTNSVLALAPKTGELLWYFQFTPHDTHDWDAQEPLLLVDEEFRGEPRKLLVQANRNGFLYVLDRVTGEFLMGEPFIEQTWAKGLDASGRPIILPGSDPTVEGSAVCPAIRGATNWWASAYNPDTKLFYLMVHESCMLYIKGDSPWQRGKSWLGGTFRLADGSPNQRHIRALDLQTGETVWNYAQTGDSTTYSGVLSTAGGLVFFGEDSGSFAALDSTTGKPLWNFQANQDWKASPMTYVVGGRQFVAIGSGMGFWSFALQR